MKRLWLNVILVLLVSASGWATQILPISADSLAQKADLIFIGTCLSRDVKDGAIPYTEYTFSVENAIKGDAANGGTLTIKQWGGAPGSSGLHAPRLMGMPAYTIGQKYMLYLGEATDAGLRSPIGLGQGVFIVAKQPDGTVTVENELGNRFLFPDAPVSGTPSKSKAIGMTRSTGQLKLNELIKTVRNSGGQP